MENLKFQILKHLESLESNQEKIDCLRELMQMLHLKVQLVQIHHHFDFAEFVTDDDVVKV